MSRATLAATASNIDFDDQGFVPSAFVGSDGTPKTTLSLASSATPPISPAARISVSDESGGYVPCLALLPTSNSIAAAISSAAQNSILTVDLVTAQPTRKLLGHAGVITSLKASSMFGGSGNQHALMSSSKDATIRVWDDRTPSSSTSSLTSEQSRHYINLILASN